MTDGRDRLGARRTPSADRLIPMGVPLPGLAGHANPAATAAYDRRGEGRSARLPLADGFSPARTSTPECPPAPPAPEPGGLTVGFMVPPGV